MLIENTHQTPKISIDKAFLSVFVHRNDLFVSCIVCSVELNVADSLIMFDRSSAGFWQLTCRIGLHLRFKDTVLCKPVPIVIDPNRSRALISVGCPPLADIRTVSDPVLFDQSLLHHVTDF